MPVPTPRTTAALVKGIIEVQDGVDVTPFIMAANQITSRLCSTSGYTDGFPGSEMEMIERWLAAHFYTIFDNQLSRAKAGTVSVGYQYKVDYGLKCSMYGQQAMKLDTAGSLAAFDNTIKIKRQIKVSVGWLGSKCYPNFGDIWSDLTVEM